MPVISLRFIIIGIITDTTGITIIIVITIIITTSDLALPTRELRHVGTKVMSKDQNASFGRYPSEARGWTQILARYRAPSPARSIIELVIIDARARWQIAPLPRYDMTVDRSPALPRRGQKFQR